MFEVFRRGMVTVSESRDTTLGVSGFEQTYTEIHTDVRIRFAHRIEQGVDMTILEMHSHTDSTARWTEICAAEHRAPAQSADGVRRDPDRSGERQARGRTGTRPGARPVGRRDSASPNRGASADRVATLAPAPSRTPAPRRIVQARPVASDSVRACRVESSAPTRVVDDVPAWALLACGIAFGILMLLAVAFLGGPAYA